MNKRNEYKNCPSCKGKHTVEWVTIYNDDYPEYSDSKYIRICSCSRCGMCDSYDIQIMIGKDKS